MRDIEALVASRNDIRYGVNCETLLGQMEPIGFSCPVCEEIYQTKAEAIECRDQPYDTGGLTVGTIVVVPGKSRSPGSCPEDDWTAFELPVDSKSVDHFDRVRHRVPYYVVTALHPDRRDAHRCLVTLVTLMHGHFDAGWNPANDNGHCALYRIDGGEHCDHGSNWIEMIKPLLDKCEPSAVMREEAARLARIGISTGFLL